MNTPARDKSKQSRWMDWKPKAPILADSAEVPPSKPTEPRFDGFVGSLPAESPEITAKPEEPVTKIDVVDDGVKTRLDAFRRQFEATLAPAVPAFLFRPGVSYQAGVCFSCGDSLPSPRFGRCWRCSLAWRLACRLPLPAELAAALDAARVAQWDKGVRPMKDATYG